MSDVREIRRDVQREFDRLPEHGRMQLHERESRFGRRVDYVAPDRPDLSAAA